MKEPLKVKSIYDPPSESEEEVDNGSKVDINMNGKIDYGAIQYVQKQNELLRDNKLKIKFLRNFLTIYTAQIIFLGLLLALTLIEGFAQFLKDNSWLAWIGTSLFIIFLIPVVCGFSRFTKIGITLIFGIILALFLMVSQIIVQVSSPIGYVCFVSVECTLISLYLFTWFISEDFSFISAFCITNITPVIYLFMTFLVFMEKLGTFALFFVFNIIYSLVLTYACSLHIGDWMEGGEYKEDDILHPSIRLHYDFIMIVLKMIHDYREDRSKKSEDQIRES